MSSRKEAALEQPEVFVKAATNFAKYIADVEQGIVSFDAFNDLTNFFKTSVEANWRESLDGTPTTYEQREENRSTAVNTLRSKLSPNPKDIYTRDFTKGNGVVNEYVNRHFLDYRGEGKNRLKHTEMRVAKMLVRARDHVKNNPPSPKTPQA
jgi:hypothetical protein